LRRLGLPQSREAWLERGALPVSFYGAGGARGDCMLARFESLQLGSVVFERPLIVVSPSLPRAHAPPFDALLGTAALLPFRRAGIDAQRLRLELEPGAELPRGED